MELRVRADQVERAREQKSAEGHRVDDPQCLPLCAAARRTAAKKGAKRVVGRARSGAVLGLFPRPRPSWGSFAFGGGGVLLAPSAASLRMSLRLRRALFAEEAPLLQHRGLVALALREP